MYKWTTNNEDFSPPNGDVDDFFICLNDELLDALSAGARTPLATANGKMAKTMSYNLQILRWMILSHSHGRWTKKTDALGIAHK